MTKTTKKTKKTKAAKPRCGDLSDHRNAKGNKCRAYPMKGRQTCVSGLSKEEKKELGFGGAQEGSGRPPNPKPTEIMRKLVEAHAEAILSPHFRTLGYDVVRDEKTDELTIVRKPELAAKIYGESKDGDIVMTGYDDLAAHIAAAEKLLDRIYGRPKQATEITGADGGPVTFADIAALASGGD